MAPVILVTGGEERSALAVVRSLAAHGVKVHVISSGRQSIGGVSKGCITDTQGADPVRFPRDFTRQVEERTKDLNADLILPLTDAAITALALNPSSQAEAVQFPFPVGQPYQTLSDKGTVCKMAMELGIEVPRGMIVHNLATTPSLRGWDTFPVAIKPCRSVTVLEGSLHSSSVQYASDRQELETKLRELPRHAFPLLLQERVEGQGLGVFLLVWDGELLAAFAHRRIREKPPSGGVSVLRESIPLPLDLREKCQRLLEAFDWNGVAMIEFKGESLEADPVLMEVNARFWGSLQLAIDAGVDFPRLLVQAAMGQKVEPVLSYRTGVKLRWFWGDVDHLWARLRYSKEALNLPPDAPGRIRAVADFLRGFGPGVRDEVFRWNDPWPALHETRQWFLGR